MISEQIVVFHNRNNPEFLNIVPEGIAIVDMFCPKDSRTGQYKRPIRDNYNKRMLSPKEYHASNWGIVAVRNSNGAVGIKVPAYSISEQNIPAEIAEDGTTVIQEAYTIPAQNVEEHKEVIEPTTWQEVTDYVDMVNQRAIDNPPLE